MFFRMSSPHETDDAKEDKDTCRLNIFRCEGMAAGEVIMVLAEDADDDRFDLEEIMGNRLGGEPPHGGGGGGGGPL